MTQKHVQISAYAVFLIFSVSTAGAEATKQNNRELLPAPKSCCTDCCSEPATCSACAGKMVNRIHPVGDLLSTAEPIILRMTRGDVLFGWSTPTPGGMRLLDETPEEMLIDLITQSVQPKDWCESGGRGTISYFALGKALVVNQTAEVQERVVDFLALLRRSVKQEESACAPALVPNQSMISPAAFMPVPLNHLFTPPTPMGQACDQPPAANPAQLALVPFASWLLPPGLLAGLPAAGLPSAAPMKKAYVLRVDMVEAAPDLNATSYQVQEQQGQLLGAGANSAAGLTGSIVLKKEPSCVTIQSQQIALAAERGSHATATVVAEEAGTECKQLLQVVATVLEHDSVQVVIVVVPGKAEKTDEGRADPNLSAMPMIVQGRYRVGEAHEIVLERDSAGTPRKWVELTVNEMQMPPAGVPIYPQPMTLPAPPSGFSFFQGFFH